MPHTLLLLWVPRITDQPEAAVQLSLAGTVQLVGLRCSSIPIAFFAPSGRRGRGLTVASGGPNAT